MSALYSTHHILIYIWIVYFRKTCLFVFFLWSNKFKLLFEMIKTCLKVTFDWKQTVGLMWECINSQIIQEERRFFKSAIPASINIWLSSFRQLHLNCPLFSPFWPFHCHLPMNNILRDSYEWGGNRTCSVTGTMTR